VKIDVRWSGGDVVRLRKDAEELLGLHLDVIVAGFGPTTGVLQQLTRTVPIVFTTVTDPVGAGFVDSLARPGGNATGFIQFEYTLSGKWLELLREIAPQVSRVGVVRTAGGIVGIAQWAVIGAFASPMGVELRPINVSVTGETERALSAFADGPNSGLIVTVSDVATIQRELIIALAARHRLPTVYPYRFFVEAGGLISYGPDLLGLFRQGAGYVDRILKGEKPSDLPVQAPTKYELVINLKTAKALGLTVPPTLLARADEVIE
jgi:putative ABC transport system substrate-binding protein